MEQKIALQTITSFELPQHAQRLMYISLALANYSYLRWADYDEKKLLKQLSVDLKKMLAEAQSLNEQYPNNHNIYSIRAFLSRHHTLLSHLMASTSEQ